MKKKLSDWFSHPNYFIFIFCFGIYAWSFTFNLHSAQGEGAIQLSSVSETANEDFEFEKKLKELELKAKPFDENQVYVMSPEEIEQIDSENDEVSKQIEESQIKQDDFDQISGDDLAYLISYEDPKSCGSDRNYIEKAIDANPKAAEWAAERSVESKYLPRKCVSFALNSYPEISTKKGALSYKAGKASSFGNCSHGSTGAPDLDKKGDRIKHNVPCASKKLINMTYNAYADVTACLNLDPKELFPKIYNESGFFINALGAQKDAGIGQLTGTAIDQVNFLYPKYMEEIIRAAQAKPDGACARIMKHKSLLMPVNSDTSLRCSLMWPAENPLRNIVYMAILTRYNLKYVSGVSFLAGTDAIVDSGGSFNLTGTAKDELAGKMKEYEIRKKLNFLGIKKVNLHDYKNMIVLAGYNSGISTAMNTFASYLDERIEANMKSKSTKFNLKADDFNFDTTKELVKEARAVINSSHIGAKENAKAKAEKLKRRKALPMIWKTAYTKTFPEYMALKMNSYKGGTNANYSIYGYPGYLTALAAKNKMIRNTFQTNGINPSTCTPEDFLKFD